MSRSNFIPGRTLLLGFLALLPLGCSGSDGSDGSDGMSAYEIAVANGFIGTEAEWLASLDPNSPQNQALGANPEQCVVCHSGFARDGVDHQVIYDDYVDTTLAAEITSVDSASNGGTPETWTVTMEFSISMDGAPYDYGDALPDLEQKRFYVVAYDSGTRMFSDATDISFSAADVVSNDDGTYTVTKVLDYDPAADLVNAVAFMYVADGPLDVGSHYSLYSDVANAGLASGDGDTYESTANVEACESCHGAPYRKHGYRQAEVDGLADFTACKPCHLDDKDGTHPDWQLLVDDPATYAYYASLGGNIRDHFTDEQTALYAYKRSIKSDVHMSHAMEFAYPQSMGNCATCHEGHMAEVTDQDYFTAGTCKTCHPITGVGGTDPHRAPALADLWEATGTTSTHSGLDMTNNDFDCTPCHDGSIAPVFADLHNGFNPLIYDEDGTRFSTAITATIGTVTLVGNVLTIPFTVDGSTANYDSVDVVPTVYVSFYGYDTKDFVVSNHTRDDNNLRMEFTIGSDDNALFTTIDGDGSDHTYEVELDFGAYARDPSIPEIITTGVVTRAEIAIAPALEHVTLEESLGLDAPSLTFDLTTGLADPDFYEPIVDAAKCNACHDQLATTFHSGNRGGNVVVCRMCHVPTSRGSHLELQSRSIDSYVHAIHSFQLFDPGDIDFDDPVEALFAEHHVESTFPNFTLLNCESCHVDASGLTATYNVPDQGKSMPGILSGTDDVAGRYITDLPQTAVGPGTRACGACHRTEYINEDDANGLVSVMSHMKSNGYEVEDDGAVFNVLLYRIMSFFY